MFERTASWQDSYHCDHTLCECPSEVPECGGPHRAAEPPALCKSQGLINRALKLVFLFTSRPPPPPPDSTLSHCLMNYKPLRQHLRHTWGHRLLHWSSLIWPSGAWTQAECMFYWCCIRMQKVRLNVVLSKTASWQTGRPDDLQMTLMQSERAPSFVEI